MPDVVAIVDRVLDPWPATVWAGVTALAAQLWSKFRGRLATLRWTAEHRPIALSADNARLGRIEVTFNGDKVNNLSLGVLRLVNETGQDFEQVSLELAYLDGTVIYRDQALLLPAAVGVLYSTELEELRKKVVGAGASPQDLEYFGTHRSYTIPVLNRGSSIEVSLLVDRPDARVPTLSVACPHKGVLLKKSPPHPLYLGVPQPKAIVTGFLFGLVAISTYAVLGEPTSLGLLLAYLLGGATMLVGAGILHLCRLVVRAVW